MNEDIVYMLNSYVKDGEDFLYRDNRGTVVLCKNCKHRDDRMNRCSVNPGVWQAFGYCSKGVRKEE